ncbi:endonuclease domain-containing protein [Demequina sp. SO4-18]|uniref:endonuclease domain-containing protein n=1 Tax=Demequina sp. SO4-18 TaxID=3401026 RepID=UPI003B5BF7C3
MTSPRMHAGMTSLIAHAASAPRACSRAELTARWSSHTLHRALELGLLTRMAPGIYTASSRCRDPHILLTSALMWAGAQGAVTGIAALRRWQYDIPWDGTVDVLLPRAITRPPPAHVRVRRTDLHVPTVRLDAITTVVPEFAALHAWAAAPRHARTGLLLDLLRTSRLDSPSITRALAKQPRLRARGDLLRVLAAHERGVTSYLEFVAHTEVFNGARWEGFEWQARVRVAKRTLTVDMLHRESGVAVELDGRRYHSDDHARRRDLERDALLAAAGYTVIRLTFENITTRPHWCRATVGDAIKLRLERRQQSGSLPSGSAALDVA